MSRLGLRHLCPEPHFGTGAQSVSAEGNTLTLTARDGATLVGTFVSPRDVKIDVAGHSVTATGGNEFFVVMTTRARTASRSDRQRTRRESENRRPGSSLRRHED